MTAIAATRVAALRQLPQPEPSAGVAAYLRERELCLAADPRRRENYERYLAAGRRSAKVDYLPTKLDIENVSRCNFRCTMCLVSDWKKGQRAADMPLAEFKKLIDEQYGLVEIKLQGLGEPLMQRDDFFRMIAYARARHIWVRTTTNASLLHLKDNFSKLIDTDVNELQISIDGADKATFEKIRRGSVFGRVVANCRTVNDYARRVDRLRTKMWVVVQHDNVRQLENLVDLGAELGFPQLVFSLNLSDFGVESWSERNKAVTVDDRLDPDSLLRLVDRGAALGLLVRFWNVTEKYRIESLNTLCPWPFERAYVSSDLRTVPCCYVGSPDVMEIGSAADGFAKTWFGPAYEAFRQAHLDGRIPKVCQGCYKAGEHWGDAAERPPREI
ncbi:MAG: radical SAM/SPASM domain-containing protein [Pseudomonadota bacterium]